jgi:phosphoglycolate phosphatase
MIKAVIFDLDGTLLNTVSSMAISVNRVLEHLGLSPRPEEEYKKYAGDGAGMLVKRALIAAGDTQLSHFEEAFEEYMKLFQTSCTYHVTPYDGICDLLQELKHRGILLAVLSNKPHQQAKDVIDTYFDDDIFSVVQGQVDGIPKKPDPSGALKIAQSFGVSPSECLYVGDTNVDMQTGNRANMHTVGVLWGFRDQQELMENHAQHIISYPGDLLSLLGL